MSRRVVVEDHRHTEGESLKDDDFEEEDEEYQVQDLRERIKSSLGSQFNLIKNELGLGDGSSTRRRRFSRQSLIDGVRGLSKGFVVHPDNW
ncbi:hypothetical protein TB1_024972 [Malus domestica]